MIKELFKRYFKAVAFRVPVGPGHGVTVTVPQDVEESLTLSFQRKITRDGVVQGRLRPTAWQTIHRRGGKCITTTALSYEGAEALHAALGAALTEMRRRRLSQSMLRRMLDPLFKAYIPPP